MTDTLIVIPARGSSLGVPRKAMRYLGSKPLLSYVLETCLPLADVAVVTDDQEIEQYAQRCGARVVREPLLLGGQPVGVRSLDPVIHYAVSEAERDRAAYEIVATVQPTSPFLTAGTISHAMTLARQYDTAVTVRDDRGLQWNIAAGGPHLSTLAPHRWIRQHMPPCWRETGGCLATQRRFVIPTFRFGHTVYLLQVQGREAVDIDTQEDWAVAEWYLGASARELLLARVLQPEPHHGLVVEFSGWGRPVQETTDRQYWAQRLGGGIRVEAAHTQAECQLALAQRNGHQAMTLVTSAYHQLRVFLTMLKTLEHSQVQRSLQLWNAPVPSTMVPLGEEFAKITEYQQRGDVASYDAGLEYLNWRDTCVS